MATTFYHNGNYFEIIEGAEEVILRRSGEKSGDVILPKYAMYGDKRYTVTKIIPKKVKVMKNLNADDKRKKPDWRETPYTKDASLFCRVERYYDSEEPDLSPKLDITSILIPSTVTEIGDHTFEGCTSLKSLTIPDSVTKIGYCAFIGCTSLKSLTIPDSVTSIGYGAFGLACGLESLRLSSNVKKLRGDLFGWENCKPLYRQKMGADQRNPASIKIEIPSIVEEIGSGAFDVFQNAEIIIYNEPGEVMVATNAFAPTASVKYVGKKAKADKKETPKQEAEQVASPAPTIDLDKLIDAVVADGVITDKERSVILKKAKAAGYDVDEVEILLDGKLAEKKNECQSVPETETKVESKPASKPTSKTVKKKADVAVGEVDTDAMWADVVAQLDVVKNSITCPKGRPYISFASKTHKKNISYWAGYSPRGEYAWVCIETYGGEAARDAIMSIVKSAPKGHISTTAEMKQGTRNKEKWMLMTTTSIDKPTSELVEWYVESLLAYYKFFEDAKPF